MDFGWVNDVFELDVTLEEQAKTTRFTLLRDHETQMFDINKPLKGSLTIASYNGKSFWNYGIDIKIESSTCYFEQFHSENQIVLEKTINSEGYLKDKLTYDFEFNPRATLQNSQVLENYCGQLFFINHVLIVTVKRPWYTFDVILHKNIAFQNISTISKEDELMKLKWYKSIGEEDKKLQIKHDIKLVDLVEDDICLFSYHQSYFNIEDELRGSLKLKLKNPELVKVLKLVFFKIESGDQDDNEFVLSEKSLIHHLSGNTGPIDGIFEESFPLTEFPFRKNKDGEAIYDPLSPYFLTPTFYESTFNNTVVSVRYYMRLILETNIGEHWNTSEIFLFRKQFEGKVRKSVENV